MQAAGTSCIWCHWGRRVAGAVEGRCRLQVGTVLAAMDKLWAKHFQLRATSALSVYAAASTLLHKASRSRLWTVLPTLVLDEVVQGQPPTLHSVAFTLQSVVCLQLSWTSICQKFPEQCFIHRLQSQSLCHPCRRPGLVCAGTAAAARLV